MFENIMNFLKKLAKTENNKEGKSKNKAKERLQLVLTQDRANVSADFLELMKQEIIDVIKKYIEVEENAIDVRITNKLEEDGTTGSPSLYANIPILNIKKETEKEVKAKVQVEQENKNKVENKEIKKETEKKQSQNEKDKSANENNTKENNVEMDTSIPQKTVEKKKTESKEEDDTEVDASAHKKIEEKKKAESKKEDQKEKK